MPSRHQVILSQAQGDPFLGFLGTALGALGKVAFKGIKGLFGKKVSTGLVTTGGSKLAQIQGIAGSVGVGAIASRLLRSRVLGVDSRTPKPGMRGRLERFLPGGETGFLPARRRMNPTNIHALRRATRRVAAFHKIATKAERELRKFAPRARRSTAHEHARPLAAVNVRQ